MLFPAPPFPDNKFPMLIDFVEEGYNQYDPELVKDRYDCIMSIGVDDIESIEQIGDYFTDDHVLCVDVHLTLTSGIEIWFAAMWVGPEFIAAILYNEVPRARQEIVDYLHECVHDSVPED